MNLPNNHTFRPMTRQCAGQIITWRYQPPYDYYNFDQSQADTIIDETFLNPAYQYFSLLDRNHDLVAFWCFGEDARVRGGDYSMDALDVGGGLRPDLTGRGLGHHFINLSLEFAKREFSPSTFRTTVAAFNTRARMACEKLSFTQTHSFSSRSDSMPFVILVRDA